MEFDGSGLPDEQRSDVYDVLLGVTRVETTGSNATVLWRDAVELVEVRAVLGGGRSSALVLDLNVHMVQAPEPLRRVAKIGPAAQIAAEWRAYRRHLFPQQRSSMVPIDAISAEVLHDRQRDWLPDELAAIVYQHVAEFASTSDEAVTLEEIARRGIDGRAPVAQAAQIFDKLSELLRLSPWQPRPHKTRTLRASNRELGPDLVLEVDRQADERTVTFQDPTPEQRRMFVRSSDEVLTSSDIGDGSTIELRGLDLTRGAQDCVVGRVGDLSVLIRQAAGAPRAFDLMDFALRNPTNAVVVGRVAAIRGREWRTTVERVIPDAAIDTEVVEIDGVRARQPFGEVVRVLTEPAQGRLIGLTHGDLNPRNVLVLGGQVFLIDFAELDQRPPLSDAAWLEICLLRDVVSRILDWPELVRLQRRLGAAGLLADSVRSSWDVADLVAGESDRVRRSFELLWRVRSGARRRHQSADGRPTWWREYASQLCLAALRTLAFPDQTADDVRAVLAAAGVAVEWLTAAPLSLWTDGEIAAAARSAVPALDHHEAGSAGALAVFMAVCDARRLADETLESLFERCRDGVVGARFADDARRMQVQLRDDHDVYISLQAYIPLRARRSVRFEAFRPAVQGLPPVGVFGEYGRPWESGLAGFQSPRATYLHSPADLFDHPWLAANPLGGAAPDAHVEVGAGLDPDDDFDLEITAEVAHAAPDQSQAVEVSSDRPWGRVVATYDDSDAIHLARAEWAVVVLGEAGSGKSTIARELQYLLTEAIAREADRATDPVLASPADPHDLPPLLPVTIKGEALSRAIQRNDRAAGDRPGRGFDNATLIDLFHDILPAISVDMLRIGAIHITIDALNELGMSARRRVAAWVRHMRRAYPRVPVLVCHRTNGFVYEELPYPAVVVQKVSDEQARDYIRRTFMMARLPESNQRADELIRLLLDNEESKRIRDLAQTPLFLWMITKRYADDAVLPTDIGALFRGFTDWYLTERHHDRPEERQKPPRLAHEQRVAALEALARYLFDEDNITELAEPTALQLLRPLAGNAEGLLDDLVGSEMLVRDLSGEEPLLRFRHHSFQEYFAAETLRREFPSPDLADRVLIYRKREALQLLLSFSGGSPGLATALVDVALRADPPFAARLLRWAENPPAEAVERFIQEQERTLCEAAGVYAWNAAVRALVEFGGETAGRVLCQAARNPDVSVRARSMALGGMLSALRSAGGQSRQSTPRTTVIDSLTDLMSPQTPLELRVEAVSAVGTYRVEELATYIGELISSREAFPLARAAWNSLTALGQRIAPSLQTTFVMACEQRLSACEEELFRASTRSVVRSLEEERLELLEILIDAGRFEEVLRRRFARGVSNEGIWRDWVPAEPELSGELTDARTAWAIFREPLDAAALVEAFDVGGDLTAVAAVHRLLELEDDSWVAEVRRRVTPTSSRLKLLAAAAAELPFFDDHASTEALISDLIDGLSEHMLEPLAVLLESLPAHTAQAEWLFTRAAYVYVSRFPNLFSGPFVDAWYAYGRPSSSAVVSEMMLREDERATEMTVWRMSVASALCEISRPTYYDLSEQAQTRLAAYQPPESVQSQKHLILAFATAGMPIGLPRAFDALAEREIAHTIVPMGVARYGTFELSVMSEILIAAGLLGRMAYDKGDQSAGQKAYDRLLQFDVSSLHPSVATGRMKALAVMGDWVSILTGFAAADAVLLAADPTLPAAAQNAVSHWFPGPCTPAWGTDKETIARWIAERLSSSEHIVPDVRSTLSEIRAGIERELGRIVLPRSRAAGAA